MPRCDVQAPGLLLRAEAWVLVPLFALALRLAPGAVMRLMRGAAATPSTVLTRQPKAAESCRIDDAASRGHATRVAAAVERAAAWLPARAASCLPRACAAHVMLARRGAASRLRIGVLKARGGVRAHAWVEAGGIEIGRDAAGPPFVALPAS
jgi:hypothetical protein